MIYIGVDDTDNKTSRGTGRLARAIAGVLSEQHKVWGVTRHQLLVDSRVPYTSHNSSNCVHLLADGDVDLETLADQVQAIMLGDFQDGSDPGLCIARTVTPEMVDFGYRAKAELLQQSQARDIAARSGCVLRGLGGTQDGVIGALAAVSLASTGEDGRFVLVGHSRDISGLQPIGAVIECGIARVQTTEGEILREGMVESTKLRPALRGKEAVLIVKQSDDKESGWVPIKPD